MRGEKLWNTLTAAAGEYGKTDLWLYAASGAYYMFLSLGPLAAVLLGLLPYFPFSQQELLDLLLGYAPGPLQELVQDLVEGVYANSATALGVGIVAELWSAGKLLSLIMRCVGRLYDGHSAGYLRNRLMGALYTAVALVLVLANVALLFAGESLLGSSKAMWMIMRLRPVMFFAAVTAVDALLFSTVPKRKLHFRDQLPGAAFSSAAWLLFSQIYFWAVERFGFYSIYGGLAIVIISLFWMYCSLYILFLGAWLNTMFEKKKPA